MKDWAGETVEIELLAEADSAAELVLRTEDDEIILKLSAETLGQLRAVLDTEGY